jgi:hypothetical protein
MTALESRIENARNEGRILILGAQVLIGSGFQTVFTSRFSELPSSLQTLRMIALISLSVSLCLLLLPVPFHSIAENNALTSRFQKVTNRMLLLGLFPFVIGLSVDMQTVAWGVMRPSVSVVLASVTGLLGAGLWYGLGMLHRRPMRLHAEEERRPPLRERI